MKLVDTNISETAVRMRYADNADPAKATTWLDFQFPLAELTEAESSKPRPLGDPQLQFVGEVQRAALRRLRALVSDEMQRYAALASRHF